MFLAAIRLCSALVGHGWLAFFELYRFTNQYPPECQILASFLQSKHSEKLISPNSAITHREVFTGESLQYFYMLADAFSCIFHGKQFNLKCSFDKSSNICYNVCISVRKCFIQMFAGLVT